MKLIHRTKADYITTPWKNGGGITTELAIFPAGMTVTDPFVWRISRSQIKSSGAFSQFPGYERHILQLDGDKVTLDHGEFGSHDLSPQNPYTFSGDWSTSGILQSGPVQDLNCILSRSHCQGGMQLYNLNANESLCLKVMADFTVLHVVTGSVITETPETTKLMEYDCLILHKNPNNIDMKSTNVTGESDLRIVTIKSCQLVWMNIKFQKN